MRTSGKPGWEALNRPLAPCLQAQGKRLCLFLFSSCILYIVPMSVIGQPLIELRDMRKRGMDLCIDKRINPNSKICTERRRACKTVFAEHDHRRITQCRCIRTDQRYTDEITAVLDQLSACPMIRMIITGAMGDNNIRNQLTDITNQPVTCFVVCFQISIIDIHCIITDTMEASGSLLHFSKPPCT